MLADEIRIPFRRLRWRISGRAVSQATVCGGTAVMMTEPTVIPGLGMEIAI